MPKFSVNTDVIKGELGVDGDGDLTLRLNGILVLYVEGSSGKFFRMYLSHTESEELKAAGIKISQNGLVLVDGEEEKEEE